MPARAPSFAKVIKCIQVYCELVEMMFKGKTVIITGASGGIGSESALLFAKEGANITVNFFSSPEKAQNTVRKVKSLGVEAFSFKADISNPQEVSFMVKETVNRFGGINVLANNAAKHPPPIFDFDKPDWELEKNGTC